MNEKNQANPPADIPLSSLVGVGKQLLQRFGELGIHRAGDLLDYFPFRYDDLRQPTAAAKLGTAESEENALGRIVSLRERRGRLAIVEARIADESGHFEAKWFGRSYLIGVLREGARLFVRGRVTRTLGGPLMNVSTHRMLREDEEYRGEVVPVYRASKTLPSRTIRGIVKRNGERLLATAAEQLPETIRNSRNFMPAREAYRAIHFPDSPERAEAARRQFVFAEFFALALAAELKRRHRATEGNAPAVHATAGFLNEFEREVRFTLTRAQRRVIEELIADMGRSVPMNRLLQGDVGSGKTLVAAAAIVAAARNGVQSALMAPTEILASQHAAQLAPLLIPFGISVEAFFGSRPARERAGARNRLASGQALLAVGTHALLSEGVDFPRLGLTVIDEQHRFGVTHRARLRAKGAAPHTLHMTATPIPRTLAQTMYADLDISTIDELPPGRTPVRTFTLRAARLSQAYEFVRKNVEEGRQAYIVAPAIEESAAAMTSAVEEAQRLREGTFADRTVGLLHGRLSSREKDAVMGAFVRGEIEILIATTVIEVGVDVPNATVMVVLDAHRYGLSQLHQLRGRVGRGADQSFCLLIAPDDSAEQQRLTILTQTSDGFEVAERDLAIRGPGELAGTAQSGLDEFRVADLRTDIAIYAEAKREAARIVAADPELTRPEHRGLRELTQTIPSARAMLLSS